MDYPVKTLSQWRPLLLGFRKAAGLTQAMMASRLGVAQQTYAQLEANPASASVERLFRVLHLLDVDMTLTQASTGAALTKPLPMASPAEGRRPWRRHSKAVPIWTATQRANARPQP